MAEKNILEWIVPCLMDRVGRTYIEKEEYKEVSKNADAVLEKLEKSLNKEQAGLLEAFLTANNAAGAVAERLIYRQGMHDLLDLLVSVLKDS